jgi:site-specific DNA recombinase
LRREVTQAAQKKAIKDGKFAYGTLPFGYQKDKNGYLQLKENEAQIVRKIFDLYIEGKTTPQIALELIQSNMRKPDGNVIRGEHIAKILRNKTYTGIIHKKSQLEKPYSKKRILLGNIPATHKTHVAIVSENEFDLVQSIMNMRSKSRTKKFHLLSGHLLCPNCHSIMYGEDRGKRYVCKNYRLKLTQCNSIMKCEVEEKVLDFLSTLDNDEHDSSNQQNLIYDRDKLLKQLEDAEIKYAKGKLSETNYERTISSIKQKLSSVQQSQFNSIATNKSTFKELIRNNEFIQLKDKLKKEKIIVTIHSDGKIIFCE